MILSRAHELMEEGYMAGVMARQDDKVPVTPAAIACADHNLYAYTVEGDLFMAGYCAALGGGYEDD